MNQKTIDEEIPVTKEGLEIYRKGLQKELDRIEPVYKRLNNVLARVDKIMEKMK